MADEALTSDELLSKLATPEATAPSDRKYWGGFARTLLGQGAAMGWGDEIMAKLRSVAYNEDYDKALADERGKTKEFKQQNPKTALAAELGGAFLTPGLGMVAGALKPAASTLGSMAKGAVLGSGIGAVAGAGAADEDKLAGAKQGATFGAIVGPALPAIGKLATSAVSHGAELLGPTFARAGARLPGSVSTPAEAAADNVMMREMRAGNLTPQMLRDELATADRARTFHGGVGATNASEAQSPLGLVDLSPTMQKLAGSAARASPEAAARAEAFIGTRQTGAEPATDAAKAFAREGGLESRNPLSVQPSNAVLDVPAGQHERIRGALQRAYTLADKEHHGFAENAYRTEQDLLSALKQKADQLYGDFRTAQAGYDVRPDIQPAITKWTKQLTDAQVDEGNIIRQGLRAFTTDGKEWVKSADAIDKGKRAIDAKIQGAKQAGNANKVRILSELQNDFIGAIDNIKTNDIGTKWQAAREHFSGEKKRQEAIQWGREALKMDSNASADQFSAFPEDMKKLARLGILESLTTAAGPKKRAADLTQVLETNRAQDLLRETIPRAGGSGPYSVQPERFGNYLANEKAMIATRDKVLGNSATAGRLADDERLTRQTLSTMFDRFKQGGIGVVPLALEAVSAGLTKVFGFREDVARELGRRLFTANPAEREAIIQRLEAKWGRDKVGAFTSALEKTTSAGSLALPVAGGLAIGQAKNQK